MSLQIVDCLNDVGPGWETILRELHEGLLVVAPEYGVGQIKEKFGTLRVYLDYDIDCDSSAAEALVRTAESKSAITCEMCGEPGRLVKPRSWYKTACESCEAAAIARMR